MQNDLKAFPQNISSKCSCLEEPLKSLCFQEIIDSTEVTSIANKNAYVWEGGRGKEPRNSSVCACTLCLGWQIPRSWWQLELLLPSQSCRCKFYPLSWSCVRKMRKDFNSVCQVLLLWAQPLGALEAWSAWHSAPAPSSSTDPASNPPAPLLMLSSHDSLLPQLLPASSGLIGSSSFSHSSFAMFRTRAHFLQSQWQEYGCGRSCSQLTQHQFMMWERLQREPLSTTLEFMHACIPLGTFIYLHIWSQWWGSSCTVTVGKGFWGKWKASEVTNAVVNRKIKWMRIVWGEHSSETVLSTEFKEEKLIRKNWNYRKQL